MRLFACVLLFVPNFLWERSAASSLGKSICEKYDKVIVNHKQYFSVYLATSHEDKVPMVDFKYGLKTAMEDCCPNVAVEWRSLNDSRESQENIQVLVLKNAPSNDLKQREFSFYFPEFAEYKKKVVYDFDLEFLRLRHSPGQVVVMKKHAEAEKPLQLYQIFYVSYPLFLLMIILAWFVGILGWILDHWKNSEQFPNPFIIGMFEAFWWSIVTMTTVGYGDKTPKSGPARLLAIIWIMSSAILLSLFTANTTAVLQEKLKDEDHSITFGKTFGTLHSKHFDEDALGLTADIKNYENPENLYTALINGDVDRVLFPSYKDLLRLFLNDNYQLETFVQIVNVFTYPFEMGMVLSRGTALNHNDTIFLNCLRTMLTQWERTLNDTGVFSDSLHQYDSGEVESPLSQSSLIQYIYYLLMIIAGFIILGLSWDIWKYTQDYRSSNHEKGGQVNSLSNGQKVKEDNAVRTQINEATI